MAEVGPPTSISACAGLAESPTVATAGAAAFRTEEEDVRPIAQKVHLVVAWLLVGGLPAQIFLAGLGVFRGPESFLTHRDFGYVLEGLPILLLILGVVAGLGRRLAILAAVIFGLFLLQSVFVELRVATPGRRTPPGQRLRHHDAGRGRRPRRLGAASAPPHRVGLVSARRSRRSA